MQAKIIEIQASDKVMLDGLILGPKKAKEIYIFLHGLGGDLFSRIDLARELIGTSRAVMIFNNRGYGLYNRFKKIDKKEARGYLSVLAGSAAEIFKHSLHDISGAISEAKKEGFNRIILVGHSTGCNKIAYYLSKNRRDNVLAGIFLAPMSDFAYAKQNISPKLLAKAELEAKKLLKQGKGANFLDLKYWPELISAQRFLSLYTKDSLEEIFCFASPEKKSEVLQKIKKPILTILASEDEYADREVFDYLPWFENQIRTKSSGIKVISGANHSFKNKEQVLKKEMLKFVKSIKKQTQLIIS